MNIEQKIVELFEPRAVMASQMLTAVDVLKGIGVEQPTAEDILRVARFMPNFCRSRASCGHRVYQCGAKLKGAVANVANAT